MDKQALVRTTVAAAVAGLGLSVGAVAMATADEGTPTTSNASGAAVVDRGPGHHEHMAAELASALGVSEAKVAGALEAVREELRAEAEAEGRTRLSERLDAAVDDGDLTAADKGSVLKAHDAGVLGGPGGGPGFGPGGGPGPGGR